MGLNSKQQNFQDVSQRPEVDEMERNILTRWKKDKTFEKSIAQHKGKQLFTFYDGPPYATGKPHYGHVLQSAIKDSVLRYKTMRGYFVPRRVGWDTHGLPVEVLVEKELGLKNKRDIEEYGIEMFNQKCREAVFRYIDVFTETLQRLGRWADYENGYATLDRDYMESEWWVFKQLWEKELVYKDFRSTPYCVRCATPLSNFETSSAYKDRHDTAVYVLLKESPTSLKLRGADQELWLLIWTTTPWTLPGNTAVAINPELHYVSVEHEGRDIIVAEERVEAVFGSNATITSKWTADELQKLAYESLYRKEMGVVVESGHVTAEDGTGLVHIAPAFGEDDAAVGKANDLPVLRVVDTNGHFTDDVPNWAGKRIWDANENIVEDLKSRELLFKKEHYKHSYPHCWRCDEPLIYYALDSWFVKIADLKERMLEENENINWIPQHIKHGRFAKGIEMAPDWAVSRNRFWSTPIPVWECDSCDARVCVGDIAELQQKSGAKEISDIHRPYVDEYTWGCDACDGTMRRIEEVLDVWFDAGSMPYAQWHYPFENKDVIKDGYPADFVVEAIEQTRLWFYVMHVLGVATQDQHAYKNVIGSGIIFGEDGNKLSKKLQNYPEIEPTFKQYGADTVRLFFLSSTLGEPYVFSEKELRQLYRNFTMTLWNVYGFFVRYANAANYDSAKSRDVAVTHILDKWILARLHELQGVVTQAMDEYRVDAATRAFIVFVDDLSNWYVRRSRERFQPRGNPEEAAFYTLHTVLVSLVKMLAPLAPFITEEMYGNLVPESLSVHLEQLPDVDEVSEEDRGLLTMMEKARAIVSDGLAARAAAGIKVRQPLAVLRVPGAADLPVEVLDMIRDEVNVDEIVESGSEQVELDVEITPELKARGVARELIRNGQTLRRQAGYEVDDHITLLLQTQDSDLAGIIETQREAIMSGLQADELIDEGDTDAKKVVLIDQKDVTIGVKK